MCKRTLKLSWNSSIGTVRWKDVKIEGIFVYTVYVVREEYAKM